MLLEPMFPGWRKHCPTKESTECRKYNMLGWDFAKSACPAPLCSDVGVTDSTVELVRSSSCVAQETGAVRSGKAAPKAALQA